MATSSSSDGQEMEPASRLSLAHRSAGVSTPAGADGLWGGSSLAPTGTWATRCSSGVIRL
eukprot:5462537-Prymnesium_polylepis.3